MEYEPQIGVSCIASILNFVSSGGHATTWLVQIITASRENSTATLKKDTFDGYFGVFICSSMCNQQFNSFSV
jgi:hypothetical protein